MGVGTVAIGETLLVEAAAEADAMLRGEIESLRARLDELAGRSRFGSGVSAELAREGLAVVPDVLPPDECDALVARLDALLDGLPDVWPYEDERVIQTAMGSGYRGLEDYGSLWRCDKPVIFRRVGDDDGMLDVFNVDRLIPELEPIKRDSAIRQIIAEQIGVEPGLAIHNAYVNDSVVRTRDYHYDGFVPQFKAFLYLTDVPDLESGPLSYVRRSHQPGLLRALNQRINARAGGLPTDAPLHREADVAHVLAPRGTLILSNQSGIHRGLPQAPGRRRVALVTSYFASA